MARFLSLRSLCTVSSTTETFSHVPVLLNEVLNVFNSSTNKTVLDLTFGYGGHSKAMLQSNEHFNLFAFDRDPIAINHAINLSHSHTQLKPIKGKFSELFKACQNNNIAEKSVDFILMDLGSSSMQMDDGTRGFSLSKNSKLDMRMDKDSSDITALDVINNLGAAELANIFKKYGDEKESRKVANMIVDYRSTVGPIVTTHQLADLIFKFVKRRYNSDSIGRKSHPATQIFLALRIFVNDELNELCSALTFASKFLKPMTGRCVVISFHSLEDRLVKWAFNGKDFTGVDKVIKRMVNIDNNNDDNKDDTSSYMWTQVGDIITPSEEEVNTNPRSRSAKMRIGRIVHS